MTAAVVSDPLEPVRDALVERTRAASADLVAAAASDARARMAAGRAEAGSLLDAAREAGRREAAERLREERADAEQWARSRVLSARRALFDQLRERSCAALRDLLADPWHRAALRAIARRELGPDAAIADTEDGGITATTPAGRHLDASVGALVDAALARLDLEALWTLR